MIQKPQKDTSMRSRAERAVIAVLPSSTAVEQPTSRTAADLIVNGHPIEVKWVGKGRLGDVRRILKEYSRSNLVIVAHHLSLGAREALSDAGINWVDETGAAEIVVGNIVISRSGIPKKKVTGTKNWTPAVQAVAEALLCGTPATQSAVQADTGLSGGASTNALRFLTDLGLLSSDADRGPASGRRIADVRNFLGAYADAAAERQSRTELQIGVTWQDIVSGIENLGRDWDREGVAWAVTGSAAAAVIAPYLSSVSRATIYVDGDTLLELDAIATRAQLRPVEGGRLTLKPFPTVSTRELRNVADGLHVAPWPRVYADLRTEGVRGEEAAEHLFEVCYGG
jgi:hypothetical protein